MLHDKRIQTYVAQVATVYLSRVLDSRVKVGSVEFEPINSLLVRDVYIEDRRADTLAYVGLIDVSLSPLRLLKREIVVDHIDVVGLYGNIAVDEQGRTNADFLLDAIPVPKGDINLEGMVNIGQVNLVNARLRYRREPYSERAQCSGFDVNNLYFDDIDASLALNHLSLDSINVRMVNFSAHELSGLTLSRLYASVSGNRQSLVADVEMQLPSSRIVLNDISAEGYQALFDSTRAMDWSAVRVSMPDNRISLAMSDLAFMACDLANNRAILTGDFVLCGAVDSLQLSPINFRYNGHQLFSGSVYASGLPDIKSAKLVADIDNAAIAKSDIQDLVSDIRRQPVELGPELGRLGTIRFRGHATGSMQGVTLKGLVTTAQGSVTTNVAIKRDSVAHRMLMSGKVTTRNFKLGRTVGVKEIGAASADLEVNVIYSRNSPIVAHMLGKAHKVELLNYSYEGIDINGTLSRGIFDGKVTMRDPNLDFDFSGLVNIADALPKFDFTLDLRRFHPYNLNMGAGYPLLSMSTKVNINMTGSELDNLNGYIIVDSLLVKNGNKRFYHDHLVVTSEMDKQRSQLKINSNIVNANFEGKYLYSTLWPSLQKIAARNMPSMLSDRRIKALKKSPDDNEMHFYVYIQSLDDVFDVLDLPLEMDKTATVKGYLSDADKKFSLRLGMPDFAVGNVELNDITLNFNNDSNRITLDSYLSAGDVHPVQWRGNIVAGDDSVDMNLVWDNSDSIKHHGDISMGVAVSKENGRPIVALDIRPSQIIIADSIWNLSCDMVRLNADTTVTISDFYFLGSEQYLTVDGRVGRHRNEALEVAMSNLNLGYIMQFVPLVGITFGGYITGDAIIYSVMHDPILNADVYLEQAQINNYDVGNIHATSDWDGIAQRLNLHGVVLNDARDTMALADGFVGIPRDTVDFVFTADGLDVNFINAYTEPVTLTVGGKAYGKVHLCKAPKKKGAQLDGSAFVKDGMLGVDFLGTRYYFDDTVSMTPTSIDFDSIAVRDSEGHKGYVKGQLTHNGDFLDFRYRLMMHVDSMLAMNTTIKDNDLYYGKAYGTGNVYIVGTEKETDINVNAATAPGTSFFLNVASASTAHDNSFVTFVAHDEPIILPKKRRRRTKSETVVEELKSKLRLNLQLEATPDARVHVIIDPKTGDMLQGYGYGNLRIVYDGTDDVKLYGMYTLEAGQFGFTFQDVLRRDFKILKGSSMSWSGDPINGDVNVTAMYSTSASLNDLDNTLAQSVSRTTVPVNCMLNLNGRLTQPNLQFDVELPSADESLKQQVKNIINTDEMKNRQVLYLLLLNKFYTPDYMRTSSVSISQNDAYSVLTSTVTGQINSWLSRLTKDFTLGFNVRQEGEGPTGSQEYEAEFTYQLNNRLIINGNFGYRNDAMSTNKFMGDADIEYLLNPKGTIRAKAYTHTVDRYSLSTAQTKQGVGFVYKEEFDNGKELIQNMKQGIKDIFKKKNKKSKKTKNSKDK